MRDQAWQLLMSSDEASIARSAAASRRQESRANETVQQQQTRRTADADRHQESRANETVQQQQTRRTADANRHQDSWVNESAQQQETRRSANAARQQQSHQNESAQQQETRRTADANRQQQRRNSNGPLIEAALQCNIDRTNHMEGVELYTLGPMDVVCQFCGAIGFKSEKRNGQVSFGKLCCNGNKTHPGNVLKTPLHRNLVELFTGSTPQARFFRTHIRQFNSQFAMASLIIDHDVTVSNQLGGAAAFRIMGELHRKVGAVHGSYGRYIQTYFYDVQQQNQQRIAAFPQQHQQRALEIVDKIRVALEESNNTYIQTFKSIQQIESDIEQTTGQSIETIQLALHAEKKPSDEHRRRYNLPQCCEVSILMPNEIPADAKREVLLEYKSTDNQVRLKTLDDTHRSYDALGYPLFIIGGADSWCLDYSSAPKKTTLNAFVSYWMMKRAQPQLCNALHFGQKLFEQWIVDQYCKIEMGRLCYIRQNQTKLRRELYRGVQDAIQAGDLSNVGTPVILPATVTGSKRYMHKRLQDALTLTSRFCKPDLFITMTANPKWSEIQDQLPAGFSPQSRPDIVNRVFHLKKSKLIKLIEKDQVFGKLRAYTYTIEFQKRGLPHCHLLVFLEWPSRETITPSFLDDVISAEIPPITSSVRELVITQMMHGPCGSLNPNSPCMIDGKCDKNYPKDFSNETIVEDIDGYPKYCRRSPQDGGGQFMKTRRNQTNYYTSSMY